MSGRRQSSVATAGVLSGPNIWNLLRRKADPLIVMPPRYKKAQLLSANSLDLALGNELIVMRRGELATLRFDEPEVDPSVDLHRFYETVFIDYNETFMLHPRELVLGATLEYIVLPKDVMAYIIGRSSWGRLGLVIATATVIHPGYKGCPTLELVNIGNIPIQLFPGGPIPVAQLTLHTVGPGQGTYEGRYSWEKWVGSTGPGYSRIHVDHVFKSWTAYLSKHRSPLKMSM